MNRLGTLVRANIRNYGMILALVVVIIVFTAWSGGRFISPFNVTALMNQTAVVGVMAAGMTLVIIIRHIDLSVGFLSGFMGACAAILMMSWGVPPLPAILIVLALGAAIGFVLGWLIGKVGIPAFVVTLGAMIASHGLLLLSTSASGTIQIMKQDTGFFNSLGAMTEDGFIPPIARVGGMSLSTIIIGAIGITVFVIVQIRSRATKVRYNFTVPALWAFIAKLVVIAAVIGFVLYKLAMFSGISWTLVILAIVTFVMAFVMERTRFGRHVYGIGGNPEAALLSGVNVVKVTIIVFMIMEVLTALAGILYASRMQAASPDAGMGFELLVIAGAFIGGCSPAGGVGKVTGSLVGALIMQSLVNGMLLMHVNISVQYVIQGVILVVAVLFDILARRSRVVASDPGTSRPPEPSSLVLPLTGTASQGSEYIAAPGTE